MSLTITLLKKPYEISFSGNPIPFSFAIFPYGAVEKVQDIRLQVRVLVEQAFESDVFTEVRSQNFYPTTTGEVSLDLKSILDPYLSYYTPRPGLLKPLEAEEQRKRFKISWLLQQNGAIIGTVTESNIFYAIKGGMANDQWHPKEFFTTIIAGTKKPLLFPAKNEKVGMDETRFMYWVYPLADYAAQTILYTVYLSDGTTLTSTLSATVSGGKWAVFCVAAGYRQAGLDLLLIPGQDAVKYSIQVNAGATAVVSEYFFDLDHRNFYDTYQLLYRNSAGGLETLRLRGQVDFAADYDRDQAQKTVPPDYYTNLNLLPQSTDENTAETTKFKGDTGFISLEASEKLRDFFLSKQRMELLDGKFLPIILNTKTANFYSNKEQLISTQVEWTRAFTNFFFTPRAFMPQYRTCPAVQSFDVKQVNYTTLQIMYALETPYDRIEVEIDNGTTIYTYSYTGNTRTLLQAFTNPYTGIDTGDITIKARTICDDNSNPVDYGAYTTFVLTVAGDLLPIANDDTYTIDSGYNTLVDLAGSVLANDYDPDGDPIEVVAASGATTAGGSYAIDIAGLIAYTPPSSSYSGVDSFVYNIQNVGGATTVPATVTITVGTGSTGGGGGTSGVYVRLGWQNVITNGGGTHVTGDRVLFFFSDSAGSIPLDVTGLGIVFNFRETHFSQSSSGGTGTTNTDDSVTGFGTFYAIFSGVIYNRDNSTSPYPTIDAYSWVILTGTGYTQI